MWNGTLMNPRKIGWLRVSAALMATGMMFSSGCLLRNDLGQSVRSAAVDDVQTGLNALLQDDQEAAGQAFGSAIVSSLVELVTPEQAVAQ